MHHKLRSSHHLRLFSLSRLRNLFRKRRKISKNSKTAEEKSIAPTYHHVPKHAASTHLATTSPMTVRQRMSIAPEGRPSATGSHFQPTKTLAEQAEEMRARGRQRGEIVVGGISERPEVPGPLRPFRSKPADSRRTSRWRRGVLDSRDYGGNQQSIGRRSSFHLWMHTLVSGTRRSESWVSGVLARW